MIKNKALIVLSALVLIIALSPIISLASSLFTVDQFGNVGIGTDSPQARLDVSGSMYSRLVTATSSSIDWSQGNVQEFALTSSPTVSFANGKAGGEYTLILNQDGTGGRTVTWPASVAWPNGIAPVLTSDPNATDTVSFVYNGGQYLGSYDLNYRTSPALKVSVLVVGGGSGSEFSTSGDGGSGIVIIAYPTGSISATGGTVTTSGGMTIHTFTSSGTFTVSS